MICSQCKKEKEFYVGHKYICKDCHKQSVSDWKKKNKIKVKNYNKIYWNKNKQKMNIKVRNKHRESKKISEERWKVDNNGNRIYRAKKERFRRCKTRFAVLQRDNFTCQYCGRTAPEVILEVDHKYPKSKGGENKTENYITSCRDCNIGKGVNIIF